MCIRLDCSVPTEDEAQRVCNDLATRITQIEPSDVPMPSRAALFNMGFWLRREFPRTEPLLHPWLMQEASISHGDHEAF